MRNSYGSRGPDGKSRKERIKEITDQLEAGILSIYESAEYKAYLNCMSKFTSYSLNNCLLIALQRPDASLVCGLKEESRNGHKGL